MARALLFACLAALVLQLCQSKAQQDNSPFRPGFSGGAFGGAAEEAIGNAFDAIGDGVGNAGGDAAGGISNAFDAVGDELGNAGGDVAGGIGDALGAIGDGLGNIGDGTDVLDKVPANQLDLLVLSSAPSVHARFGQVLTLLGSGCVAYIIL
eukprot:scpid81506/ scgid14081/ 